MPTRTPFDAVSGTSANAGDVDKLPKGWIGYDSDTTNRSTSGTTELTLHTLNVPILAGRRVRITYYCGWVDQSVGGDVFQMNIKVAGTVVQENRVTIPGTAERYTIAIIGIYDEGAGATRTIAVTAVRNSGTGVLNIHNSATAPTYMLVEDIGPSS